MKLVFLIENAAVGKMTVGQELLKITELRLFHNHMTIEPVLEIFGTFNSKAIYRLREVIFEEFASSSNYGMIFTFMWAFDERSDWEYIEHVKGIFKERNPATEFYYVELVAPQEICLQRNTSANNIEWSNRMLIDDDAHHRLESFEGEIPFDTYLKIDTSHMDAQTTAEKIKKHFKL